jgi:hypothetical protein
MLSYNQDNDFTGGFILDAGTVNFRTVENADYNILGTGTLTVNGGGLRGYDQANYIIHNQLNIGAGAQFTTGAITFDPPSSAHQTILSGSNRMTISTVRIGDPYNSVTFGENLKLTGSGSLEISGSSSAGVSILGSSNTFSGGLTVAGRVDVGSGTGTVRNFTFGSTQENENWLGTGNINIITSNTSLIQLNGANGSQMKVNSGATITITTGTWQNNGNIDVILNTGGTITGTASGSLNIGSGDLVFAGGTLTGVAVTMSGSSGAGLNNTIRASGDGNGNAVVGGSFYRTGSGVTTVDASITSLSTSVDLGHFYLVGGTLKLTKDEQLKSLS